MLRGVYREIVEPERLVFTYAWEDAEGKPGHETLVTVTFEEFGGKTKLTFHQAVFESVSMCAMHHKTAGAAPSNSSPYLAKA